MSPVKTIFLDLDGTLTDSAEGIVNCARYALLKMGGRDDVPPEELTGFIGGSLRGMFAGLLATDDPVRIEQAVAAYRERYGATGIYENRVYDGVPEMLDALASAGCTLYVATSKTTYYSVKILEHFALDGYFRNVYGSHADGRLGDKADLLAHAALAETVNLKESLMVGDRDYDILAAKKNAMRSAGVLYGYGSRLELLGAGADFICRTPGQVAELVREASSRKLAANPQ